MQKGPDQFGSQFQEILILLPNLNVSKRPYPSHALGRTVILGQGFLRLSQPIFQNCFLFCVKCAKIMHKVPEKGINMPQKVPECVPKDLIVLVLLSAHIERFSVSLMGFFTKVLDQQTDQLTDGPTDN